MASRKPDEPVAVQEAPARVHKDPWSVMIEVNPPKAAKGESPYIFVRVNKYTAQIPRGKKSKVPYPVFLRLQILEKQEAAQDALYEKMQGKNLNMRTEQFE